MDGGPVYARNAAHPIKPKEQRKITTKHSFIAVTLEFGSRFVGVRAAKRRGQGEEKQMIHVPPFLTTT